MDKKNISEILKKLKEDSKKRNFSQTIDLIVTLKDLNLKNPEEQVDFFVTLHHQTGKKISVCAFVGAELADECKKVCDETITQAQFNSFKDKKKAKALARKHDFFIAQGDLMNKVATVFGRTLGPVGKMPNPKAGAIIVAKPQIKPLYEKLQKTTHITAKKQPVIHSIVGKEDQPEKQIIDNIIYLYNQLIHHLPKEKNNINKTLLKLTMSKPINI
ncbi:50S ribosomal protein L1 [Candidatus Woesearchaeota archaeon]|jgi:large subunit ribosomal protein L1|nr:50S ribosomal protein L1 [Candidatus Woesearchaeota archaeon]|tara:strand:+ start:1449 stop:2096 length:648 start_codon:yes stop_codon:yes gene_type:complete